MAAGEISKKVLKDAVKGLLAGSAIGAGTGFSIGTSAGSSLVGPGGVGAGEGGTIGALEGIKEGAKGGALGAALLSAGARGIAHALKMSSGKSKKALLGAGAISTLAGVASLANIGPSTVRKSFEQAQRTLDVNLTKKSFYIKKIKLAKALGG